jgi:hypothetical protein
VSFQRQIVRKNLTDRGSAKGRVQALAPARRRSASDQQADALATLPSPRTRLELFFKPANGLHKPLMIEWSGRGAARA